MEATEDKLKIKLKRLGLNVKKTASVLEKANQEATERHLDALKEISRDVDHLKRVGEEQQLGEDREIDEVTKWSASVDEKIESADVEVTRVRRWLDEKAEEIDAKEREGRLKFEASSKENDKNVGTANVEVKLPKLEIAEFDGSPLDWPRFWGQFKETVDKQSIAPVSKFSYLCGYLSPKVRQGIEGLPFSSEGYNRAKAILEERYGKNADVIKAYVKIIMDLPTIGQ